MTANSPKPFLFLDVDGVIAPFGDRPEWPKQFVAVASVPIVPENRERLAVLDAAFEIIWCTDWMEHANELGAIYELPPRSYLEIPEGKEDDTAHYEVEGDDGLPLWHHDPFTRPEDLKWNRSYGSPSMVRKLPVVAEFLTADSNRMRSTGYVRKRAGSRCGVTPNCPSFAVMNCGFSTLESVLLRAPSVCPLPRSRYQSRRLRSSRAR